MIVTDRLLLRPMTTGDLDELVAIHAEPEVARFMGAFDRVKASEWMQEVDAPHRIVWGGPVQGIVAVHVWTLDSQDDGVLVRTAESWEGEPVTAQAETLQGALDESLRNWLENLKRTSEGARLSTG
jgi:RimJ/RimL family protein N-acetyltransferase